MLEIIGYCSAFFMGLVLGLIGGGGSILTVPILVYLMGINPSTATGYSLLIVGSASLFGAYSYYKKNLIDVKTSIVFAIPSILLVYLSRAYIMPIIPDYIIKSPVIISKDSFLMIFFALLMYSSSIMMLRKKNYEKTNIESKNKTIIIILEGVAVGILTGLLGAGGGFLIIPALVILLKMPFKNAVGASLMIISFKSLIGFIGDIQSGIKLDFFIISVFLACTFMGMFFATKLSDYVNESKLQKIFAIFTFVMASLIIYAEIS